MAIYKDKKHGVFLGVCSGIAKRTGVNRNLVRAGFLLSGGTGRAAYLLGTLLMPSKKKK